MNRTLHIRQEPAGKQVHLPFSNLVALLHAEGFSIKPDDYVEILKVVETFGDENLQELKYRLAPLICTTEEEQKKFYRIFEEYVRLTKSETETGQEVQKNKRKTVQKYLIALLCVLLVGAASLYFFPTPQINTRFDVYIGGELSTGEHKAIIGDTLVLDAGSVFRDKEGKILADSAEIQLSWNTGDGWSEPAPSKISVPVKKPGSIPVTLRVSTANHTSEHTEQVNVCPIVITGLHTPAGSETFIPNEKIILYPEYRGNASALSDTRWFVNDKERKDWRSEATYEFGETGLHTFRLIWGDSGTTCFQVVEKTFVAEDTLQPARLAVTSNGQRLQPKTRLNSWLWGLLLLPLSALFWVYQKHKKARHSSSGPEPATNASSLEPPFEVPMENREMLLINREPDMNLLFRSMRNKTEDEGRLLNIPQSIHAEIRSGGIPSIVYSGRQRHEEYCILIDRSFGKSQQLHLFEYLVRLFREENISVECFFYSQFDRFYNENFPAGISLQRLSELYKTHILLIFGNAHQLIYHAWPVVEKQKAEWLHEWEFKAIMTPVSYKDWTKKEEALKKQFILLPADVSAQIRLIQAIKERQLNHDKFLRSEKSFYEAEEFYFTDTKEIRNYLDDELLYQWLCAICIYPKIRWEVVTGIGHTICSMNGQPQKVNFSNLLKLSRIAWMNEGVFPEQTRLNLLKDLTVPHEIAARETLIDMLKYADLYFKGDYFFSEEKDMQQVTSEFVLYASDQKKYARYENSFEQFRDLWQNRRIPDGPLRAYLEKKGNANWQTPVQISGNNLPVDRFFGIEEKNSSRRIFNRYVWQYVLSFFLLAGLIILFTAGKPLLQSFNTSFLPLVITDSAESFDMQFFVKTDSCFQPGSQQNMLSGSLEIGNASYPLTFESADRGRITLPYHTFSAGQGRLNLTWNNNRSAATSMIPISTSGEFLLSTCINTELPPLYIRINNQNRYQTDSVQQLIRILGNYYEIIDVAQDSFSQSRLLYYSESDQRKADSIITLAGSFGLNIKKEFIPENRTPPAVPILYLALSGEISGEDWVDVPKSSIPAGIQEIWKGNRNNRLFKYDGNRIWYSTGDKFSYGIYPLTVVQRKGAVYKIISSIYEEYQVMFLKNIRGSRFDLSFCQSRFKTLDEAQQAGEEVCAVFNTMVLNYPVDNNRIYIPADGINILPVERNKLSKYASNSNIAVQQRVIRDSVIVFVNRVNFREEQIRYEAIRRSLENTLSSYIWAPGSFSASPFDRDYLLIKADNPPVEPGPDCSKIFRSMDEVRKARSLLEICRLDLSGSGLIYFPTEIKDLKNLQELNLGETRISQSAINEFMKVYPNVKLIYTLKPEEPEVEVESDLGNLIIDTKGYPDESSLKLISRIAGQLKAYPDWKIRLEANYATASEQKQIIGYISNAKNIFFKEGVNSNQITEKLTAIKKTPYSTQPPVNAKTNRANVVPGTAIRVIGINFSPVRK